MHETNRISDTSKWIFFWSRLQLLKYFKETKKQLKITVWFTVGFWVSKLVADTDRAFLMPILLRFFLEVEVFDKFPMQRSTTNFSWRLSTTLWWSKIPTAKIMAPWFSLNNWKGAKHRKSFPKTACHQEENFPVKKMLKIPKKVFRNGK